MGAQSPPTGHDIELAAKAASGDRQAYGELVRRHGSAVRGLLRRLGADSATADDLAQDAFITGFEQVAEFRGEGTFAGWIKKIAARLYLKKVKREARLIFSDTIEPAEELGGRDASGDAASRIDLDDALKALSRGERLCVSLCYGADWSHAEAAEALNLPIGTVKSHVKRGLDKLRAKLARPEEGARREAHG
ncbi:RNA polymerase sigma factor [Caulobacter sp. BP25]|uniref:RNA polymerase sigma factor n=1 Tax=Caulobacter sp. BP25 TaxID=2048900 RepID=UPI000C12D875|nr:RNA polymerase sigma factor [Caulobacter sp. BP25]PHY19985.1 RNA polymerase subunit sigma-70 [Caulobacter sp. BP25]